MVTTIFALRELTDFIWEDYRRDLADSLGGFRRCSRDATEAMMRRYIANSFPFVFSFNDLCRLLSMKSGERAPPEHAQTLKGVHARLGHTELYRRDEYPGSAWHVPLDVQPFVSIHNALWRAYAVTPPAYHEHLLVVLEVMSAAWLDAWISLCVHHGLDVSFPGELRPPDETYRRCMSSHEEVLASTVPSQVFWGLRRTYEEVGSGFIDWFGVELAVAEIESAKRAPRSVG